MLIAALRAMLSGMIVTSLRSAIGLAMRMLPLGSGSVAGLIRSLGTALVVAALLATISTLSLGSAVRSPAHIGSIASSATATGSACGST